MNNQVIQGDCLEVMKMIPDNSVDSVVCDPPYGLSFMGKHWDYDVPTVDVWRECLRVLKPGGHLLSFAGTRTQHRMAVNIEDAGFEIRDMIAWIYGSGFPKSHNIGKNIEKIKVGGIKNLKQIGTKKGIKVETGTQGFSYSKEYVAGKSMGGKQISGDIPVYEINNEWAGWGTALKPSWESITVAQKQLDSSSIDMIELVHIIKKTLCLSQSNASTVERILRSNHSEQNEEVNIAQWIAEKNINILEDLSVLMDMLQLESEKNSNWNIVLLWLNILGEIYKQTNISTTSTELNTTIELKTLLSMEWENIFQNIIQAKNSQTNGLSANVWNAESIFNALRLKLKTIQELSVQENATLKEKEITFAPNLSPIIMSRKPLAEKTVAENCLKWGVGGINIDESRVEYQGKEDFENTLKSNTGNIAGGTFKCSSKSMAKEEVITQLGRFPANLIHDGSPEVLSLFPEGKGAFAPVKSGQKGFGGEIYGKYASAGDDGKTFYGDGLGSAARFFYCAKASKRDRNEGCEGLEEKEYTMNSSPKRQVVDGVQQDVNFTTKPLTNKNNHPTVKPTDLMRYLCRLVTPKGGTVLDPFMGSGSTGKAAKLEGFDFIGIEREAEYVKIAEARINAVKPESKLL